MEETRLYKVHGRTVSSLALRWIERRDRKRPFFVYLHLMEPHWPYHSHDGAYPESRQKAFSYAEMLRLSNGARSNAALRDRAEMAALEARYDEEINEADRIVEEFMGALDEDAVGGNTLVVVVGDHGEEFLEHNGFSHGHDVFEEQLRVPLLLLWPWGGAGAVANAGCSRENRPMRVDVPVSLLDLLPTLAEMFALGDLPQPLDGLSLVPLLGGGAGKGRPAAVSGAEARVTGETGGQSRPAHGIEAGSGSGGENGAVEMATRSLISEAFLPGKSYVAYRQGDLKLRLRHGYEPEAWMSPHVLVFDLKSDPGEHAPLPRTDERVAALLQRARAALSTKLPPSGIAP